MFTLACFSFVRTFLYINLMVFTCINQNILQIILTWSEKVGWSQISRFKTSTKYRLNLKSFNIFLFIFFFFGFIEKDRQLQKITKKSNPLSHTWFRSSFKGRVFQFVLASFSSIARLFSALWTPASSFGTNSSRGTILIVAFVNKSW